MLYKGRSVSSPFLHLMSERKQLYLLLLATLVVRLPWVFMVPMYEAPDENTHFYIIKYLAENLRLPGPDELSGGGQASVYVPLPQFGYIPHVLAMWSLSWLFDPSMAPRFGSFLLAPLMTFCAWWLGRQLFPSDKLCAIAVPVLTVFHPQLVLVHSYANNDITSSTLATALLCLSVKSIRDGLTIKLSFLIGVLSGWLMLTKYTGYAVLPAVAIAMLLCGWVHRMPLMKLTTCVVLAALPALAISLPWFVRNYQLYNGDFMGTQSMRRHWAALYNKQMDYYVSPFQILIDRKWWRMMYFSYWGMFGYMTRPLIKPLYWAYVVFLVLSLGGLAKAASRSIQALLKTALQSQRPPAPGESSELVTVASWLVMFTCTVSNLAAMILASTGNVGGPQGRYLFTSEVPFLAGIVLGLSCLGAVWGRRLVAMLVGYNLVVYIWSFAMLYPIYGFRWKTF